MDQKPSSSTSQQQELPFKKGDTVLFTPIRARHGVLADPRPAVVKTIWARSNLAKIGLTGDQEKVVDVRRLSPMPKDKANG